LRVSVARRNLFSDITRLLISVGGVAVAIILIIVLLGIYGGSSDQMSAYINSTAADLWVAQSGSPGMLHSSTIIPASLATELAGVDGVSAVHPLNSRTTLVEKDGIKSSLIVQGFEPADGVGGPWNIAEGRNDPAPGEIVLDQVTMDKNELTIGEDIDIDGQIHRIVGVSRDTSLLVAQYAFVNIAETRRVLGPDRVNFLMLQVEDPARVDAVQQEIAGRHPELAVYTREEFAANNSAIVSSGFLPILSVIVGIAVIIGVIIVGLVVYSATLEKYREYGVLKAVGASGPRLYQIVLEQSLISSFLGYAVGALGSFAVARLITRIEVQINVAFSLKYFVGAFVAAIAMSVLASYIPARKINNIDPVIVFKA